MENKPKKPGYKAEPTRLKDLINESSFAALMTIKNNIENNTKKQQTETPWKQPKEQ